MATLYDNIIAGNSRDENHKQVSRFMYDNQNLFFDEFSYIAFKKGLEIVGAMIFCNYNGMNMDIHVHMPRLITRKTLRMMMSYVFRDLECSRLTACVHTTNDKVQTALKKAGFIYNGTLPHYYGRFENGEMYYITPDIAKKWIM